MLISFSKCETAAQACPDPLAQRPLSACLSADANINVPGAAYLGGQLCPVPGSVRWPPGPGAAASSASKMAELAVERGLAGGLMGECRLHCGPAGLVRLAGGLAGGSVVGASVWAVVGMVWRGC